MAKCIMQASCRMRSAYVETELFLRPLSMMIGKRDFKSSLAEPKQERPCM